MINYEYSNQLFNNDIIIHIIGARVPGARGTRAREAAAQCAARGRRPMLIALAGALAGVGLSVGNRAYVTAISPARGPSFQAGRTAPSGCARWTPPPPS
jgi:hypothetical protein